MKNKILSLFILATLLCSCSVQKRKYMKGFYIECNNHAKAISYPKNMPIQITTKKRQKEGFIKSTMQNMIVLNKDTVNLSSSTTIKTDPIIKIGIKKNNELIQQGLKNKNLKTTPGSNTNRFYANAHKNNDSLFLKIVFTILTVLGFILLSLLVAVFYAAATLFSAPLSAGATAGFIGIEIVLIALLIIILTDIYT